ncbi:hypothetical protein ACFSL6_02005 [Paenibacillus thailandensis]|uniref:Uncharacterized protein n=1 Tax=Paenibacillus thailandensis TaxID=393250 RepID=A0ABW5QVB7_9BACL
MMEMDRELQRVSARILALCWADPQFKRRFRQDPAGVFLEQGYTPPDGQMLTADSEPVRTLLEEADRYSPPFEAAAPAKSPEQSPMYGYSSAPAAPWRPYGEQGYPAYPAYSGYPVFPAYPNMGWTHPVYPQPYPRVYPQPYFAPSEATYHHSGMYAQPLMCAYSIPFGTYAPQTAAAAYAPPIHAAYVVPPMCAAAHLPADRAPGEPGTTPPMCAIPSYRSLADLHETGAVPPMCAKPGPRSNNGQDEGKSIPPMCG